MSRLRFFYLSRLIDKSNYFPRFYSKVSDLHKEVYSGAAASISNPLVAFTLIKRLQSEWQNVVYSEEAVENTQGFTALLKAHLVLVTEMT